VKELEHSVLKCVKDQNGNHVIQKAIERVPAEHVQFIVDAFTGHVASLATHSYGCRVIQRMLEHCSDDVRGSILEELHTCVPSLIQDQFGNYVSQHIIKHGTTEDRDKVIKLVMSNLINLSKHKFASNVVEVCAEYGSEEQKRAIVVRFLEPTTGPGPRESIAISMVKDNFGNYVIRKLSFTVYTILSMGIWNSPSDVNTLRSCTP
jgi:mRNA-binding protein PUF3